MANPSNYLAMDNQSKPKSSDKSSSMLIIDETSKNLVLTNCTLLSKMQVFSLNMHMFLINLSQNAWTNIYDVQGENKLKCDKNTSLEGVKIDLNEGQE